MAEPPRKRQKLSRPHLDASVSLIESRLSEELIVLCLSHLTVGDLAAVHRVSSHWRRLADEPSLWKRLFIRRFAPRRKVGQLPEGKSWKQLYRIQQNWLDGNARSTTLDLRTTVLEAPPVDMAISNEASEVVAEVGSAPQTIVRFGGRYFFTASRRAATSGRLPMVEVHRDGVKVAELEATELQPTEGMSITEMTMDEADSSRLAAFYSDGRAAIFKVDDGGAAMTIHVKPEAGAPVVLASMRSRLLVTCNADFTLTFHSITTEKDGHLTLARIASPMRPAFCWSPLVLTLRSSTSDRYRVNVAHAAPHFPGAWTVALHEFAVNLANQSITARETSALPTSAAPITAIEFRLPWLVASRSDNTLDCYLAHTSSSRPLSLQHTRTLYGHTAAVKTVSVGKGGRCVSGGVDGRVKVWRLPDPKAKAVEVWEHDATLPPPATVSWLSFDDERIVLVKSPRRSRESESVRVLSFD